MAASSDTVPIRYNLQKASRLYAEVFLPRTYRTVQQPVPAPTSCGWLRYHAVIATPSFIAGGLRFGLIAATLSQHGTTGIVFGRRLVHMNAPTPALSTLVGGCEAA